MKIIYQRFKDFFIVLICTKIALKNLQYIYLSHDSYAVIAQEARMPIKIAILPLSPEIGHVLPTRPSRSLSTGFICDTFTSSSRSQFELNNAFDCHKRATAHIYGPRLDLQSRFASSANAVASCQLPIATVARVATVATVVRHSSRFPRVKRGHTQHKQINKTEIIV